MTDEDVLHDLIARIAAPDAAAMHQAGALNAVLTKPPGSLGVLEDIAIQMAGITGSGRPAVPEHATVVVCAGDHGVHAQGVSPWPQEVTAQMVANFAAGGAAANVLARRSGADVIVLDVGVAGPVPPHPAIRSERVRAGTADFTQRPAMSREEAWQAVAAGVRTANDVIDDGTDIVLTGDMGIANTTSSAALIAVFTGEPAELVTGRGTGVDAETWRRKVAVVKAGLSRHRPDPLDPIGVLAAVGGLEHGAIAGLVIASAARRVPLVVDGVIAAAALLVAHALAPAVVAYVIAGHRGSEPGHTVALNHLGLRPVLELDLRLGEGSGALLALPVVRSAVACLTQMATFDSAGVTGKEAT